MPLLDHFHEPLLSAEPWTSFHALWPAMTILRLNPFLPADYRVEPRVQIGVNYEVDVGAIDRRPARGNGRPSPGNGGVAVLGRPAPTVDVGTELDEPTEVGLHVLAPGRILVAAVEFVSPANKDRPDRRRAFAEKVADLVRQGVSVSVVDIVGNARFNLYADTLGLVGHADPTLGTDPSSMYAVTCRTIGRRPDRRFQAWAHPLRIGQPLPTIPLWLNEEQSLDLNLELSYADTCQVLRLPGPPTSPPPSA